MSPRYYFVEAAPLIKIRLGDFEGLSRDGTPADCVPSERIIGSMSILFFPESISV